MQHRGSRGSLFKSVARVVTPLAAQAVRYAGRTGLETWIGILSDVLSCENVKAATKRRASAAFQQANRSWICSPKGSHHNDVTCIYSTQNLFQPGKYARTISLNTHHVVVFKNSRDTVGVGILTQQAYPGRVPFLMDCFQDAISQPYGYLLFDLHSSTPDLLRFRTNALAHPTIVY